MLDELQLGRRAAEVRAAPAGAADVQRALDTPRRRCRRGVATGVCGFGLGLEFVADLAADAHQVAPRGLHVTLAEGQAHAGLQHIGHGHGTAARIQADEVAHTRVGAELAWPRQCHVGRIGQAHQRGAQARQRSARVVQRRQAQVAQQAGQGRFAVELGDDVAFAGRHLARRADGLRALGDARDQRHLAREGHARQATLPDTVGQVHGGRA